MRCERCKKNRATVHMKHPLSGIKKELYLCEECSETVQIIVLLDNMFEDNLKNIHFVPTGALKDLHAHECKFVCKECGVSFEELKKGGYLGCTTCYQDFCDILKPFLEGSHGNTTHEGKYPRRGGKSLKRENEILKLRFLLNKSIEEEDFEKAAFLRDKIRFLDTSPVDGE